MRTQYYTAVSLDGFIATPDDSLEWLFPLGDVNDSSYPLFIQKIGALAMGAATYEWMLRRVIRSDSASPGEWPYSQPVWVFTHRSLEGVPGADSGSFLAMSDRSIRRCWLRQTGKTCGWWAAANWWAVPRRRPAR